MKLVPVGKTDDGPVHHPFVDVKNASFLHSIFFFKRYVISIIVTNNGVKMNLSFSTI